MLLLLYGPFFLWLLLRKSSIWTVGLSLVAGLFFYMYTTEQLKEGPPLENTMTMQWTMTNIVNGKMLRGFMKTTSGQKIYCTYKFQNEAEKISFEKEVLGGQFYIVQGELVTPPLANHVFSFSMASYFKAHNAQGIYEITSMRFVASSHNIFTFMAQQRQRVRMQIEQFFPESIRAEAKALLIGDQSEVELQHTKLYQQFGISHLFAISGLHVGIMSFLLYEGLLRLRCRVEYARGIVVCSLPLYALFVGGAPSVWRAVMMVLLILLAKKLEHVLTLENAIAISFIIFVLVSPNSIYQIGFQLSYLATLAIILSSQIITRQTSSLAQAFVITTVCQLLVGPLLLHHFFELSLTSFVMNLLFVPLFSFFIVPMNGLLLLCCFIMKPLFSWLLFFYEPLRRLLWQFMFFLQQFPIHVWTPGRPTVILLLLLFGLLYFFFYFWEKKKYPLVMAFSLTLPVLVLNNLPKLNTQLTITFLSVGQGDCTIIEMPNRSAVYMIDTGGILRFEEEDWQRSTKTFEVGRQIVIPYLKGRGITKIDKLILSHADADHVEAAEEVLQSIKVKEIHLPPNAVNELVMADVIAEATAQQIPLKEQLAGDIWYEGHVGFQYIMPYSTEYNGNNSSLVTVITYKDEKILLPGDLEKEGEQELLQKNPEVLQGVTVLKAGHHGSKTSTTEEFLRAVAPKTLIFSTGLNNRYNHPATEVVERVVQASIPFFNTADDGTIILDIDHGVRWRRSE
ncbi:DNA internalization-related competence protein ComEC/Rec2 [Kurthia sibirica]|nr:DNA internalization-related competence protein ComEC/Rec2 [Kurthia sibirica]